MNVAVVAPEEIESLCRSSEHQGICAEVSAYAYANPSELLKDADSLVVALDEVQDPQNLGAVCRVAEVAGASGVVIPERRAAQVTPAVCRASAGAVEHLRVARVRNLADWLASAKQAGAWAYGASPVPAAVAYAEPAYSGRGVLVVGGEGHGLRPRGAAACGRLGAVPM